MKLFETNKKARTYFTDDLEHSVIEYLSPNPDVYLTNKEDAEKVKQAVKKYKESLEIIENYIASIHSFISYCD